MLYIQTVTSELLALLEQLMSMAHFDDLRLVGGAALALQIGHRNAVDIDLFGHYLLGDNETYQIFKGIGEVEVIHITKAIKQYFFESYKS